MDVGNVFSRMERYLGSDFSVYLISKEYKDKFKESFELMWNHIQILERDEIIEGFDSINTPRVVEACINYLTNVSVEVKVDTMFKKFIADYVFIVHNWNNNVWKNNNFNYKIQHLQRVVENRLSLDEVSNMINGLSKNLGRDKEWLPPAFELSKHYYNLLKED